MPLLVGVWDGLVMVVRTGKHMSRVFFARAALACPVVLGALLLTTGAAGANETQAASVGAVGSSASLDSNSSVLPEQLFQYSSEGRGAQEPQDQQLGAGQLEGQTAEQAQVTSISQLSDVRPTDWAFQALQSLVERYGVIAGYPDGTYRGNRALTRYEFAAGLNAALDRVNELLAAGLADKVSREDLATLQRLQEEFAAELATIRGLVDNLEARTAQLEANQFSTTTKLGGEVIFSGAGFTGTPTTLLNGRDQAISRATASDSNITFNYRVRLNFNTSFTGSDLLTTRIQGGNVQNFNANTLTGTNQSRLGFDTGNNDNTTLARLFYRFPIFGTYSDSLGRTQQRGRVFIGPVNTPDDFLNTISPFDSTANGAISRFGIRNPIYRIGGTGTSLGFDYNITPWLNFSALYSVPATAGASADPTQDNGVTVGNTAGGLFGGTYAGTAQLIVRPLSNLDIGLTYVRAFLANGSLGTGTGSQLADRLTNFSNNTATGLAANADSYGLEVTWRVLPKIVLTGWANYTTSTRIDGSASAQSLNYMGFVGFSDFLREGNLLAVGFGQPPKRTGTSGNFGGLGGAEEDTSYQIEAFYRIRVSSNINITPGVFYLLSPENNDKNTDILVGVVRTTFTF